MKTLKYISFLLSLLLLFTACERNDELTVYHPDKVTAPNIKTLGTEYVLRAKNQAALFDTLRWDAASFGFPTEVKYSLKADLAGKSFENAIDVTSTVGSLKSGISVKEMNDVMLKLQDKYNFTDSTQQVVEFKLLARLTDNETIESNVISTKITPYKQFPLNMYMIGTDFGNWDWSSPTIAELIPVHGVPGVFWTVRYFNAGNGFKWAPKKLWSGDFFQLNQNEGFTTHDGNAFVAADGFYIVCMDYNKNKITIEPTNVYVIGDVNGGWGNAASPFVAAGNKLTFTAKGSGGLRLYATSSAIAVEWWQMEFVILDGKIVYRGNGKDQDRVDVSANQVLTLDLNAGTGTIE